MSTKLRTILAWVFGVFSLLMSLSVLTRQPVAGLMFAAAGALLLPPVAKRISGQLAGKWRITIAVVLLPIALVVDGRSRELQKQTVTQNPAPSQPIAVSSRARAPSVYDIPSLFGKNYNQVKAVLGKTTKVFQNDDDAEALFTKQGFQFYVTYNPKTKEVLEFFLVTDDPSGKTKDIDRLMDIGNLTKDDARYTVEFTRPLDDKSAYTGIEIRTAAAAKAKADRAKAVKNAEKYETLAAACAQVEVRAMLKAPSTAKFPRGTPENILFSPEENSYTIISYVDAQNSFGAMISTDYTCVVTDLNPDTYACDAQCELQ